MTAQIIKLKLSNGNTIFLRSNDTSIVEEVSGLQAIDAGDFFESLGSFGEHAIEALKKAQPKKLALSFSVECKVESGKLFALIGSGSAGGTISVEMTWEH